GSTPRRARRVRASELTTAISVPPRNPQRLGHFHETGPDSADRQADRGSVRAGLYWGVVGCVHKQGGRGTERGRCTVSRVDTPDERMDAIATANRRLAADMFDGLSDEQWRTPSLCAGWTVREVAAHLVPPANGFTILPVLGRMIRFRGD